MATLIHYVERLIDFWRQTGAFVAGNQKLLAEIIWPHFWAIQIILFVLIAMYCTMHELVRVIGKGKGAADILRRRCLRRKFERRAHRRGEEEQLDSISTKDDWKTVFAFEKYGTRKFNRSKRRERRWKERLCFLG